MRSKQTVGKCKEFSIKRVKYVPDYVRSMTNFNIYTRIYMKRMFYNRVVLIFLRTINRIERNRTKMLGMLYINTLNAF